LGSSPFARHYSGSRGFFPFLGLLRCFSSPACHCLPYGFRQEHARITTRRFPHSEIPGSIDGQLLPRAYRSRPRPSSALGAKASTVCPSSLDHEEHLLLPLWSFQGARELERPQTPPNKDGLSKLNSVTSAELDIVLGARNSGRLAYGPWSPQSDSSRPSLLAIDGSETPTGVIAPASLERR
jgi:hypothetical protein